MASLKDVMDAVAANKEVFEIPYENIPEERGAFTPVPQPGLYRFRLPTAIDQCFDVLQMKEYDKDGNVVMGADGKPKTKPRISLVFEGVHALTIVQARDEKYVGEAFKYRINNAERLRGKKDAGVKISDLTYLLRAVAAELQPKTNEEFIQACLQALPGKEFSAELEYQSNCAKDKDAYYEIPVAPEQGGGAVYETIPIAEGSPDNFKGCGLRVYHSQWPKVGGLWAERMTCPGTEEMPPPPKVEGQPEWKPGDPKCGAALRPFPQLVRFKA